MIPLNNKDEAYRIYNIIYNSIINHTDYYKLIPNTDVTTPLETFLKHLLDYLNDNSFRIIQIICPIKNTFRSNSQFKVKIRNDYLNIEESINIKVFLNDLYNSDQIRIDLI